MVSFSFRIPKSFSWFLLIFQSEIILIPSLETLIQIKVLIIKKKNERLYSNKYFSIYNYILKKNLIIKKIEKKIMEFQFIYLFFFWKWNYALNKMKLMY